MGVTESVDRQEVLDVLFKVRARIDKPQKWSAHWWASEDEKRLGVDGAVWEIAGHDTPLAAAAFRALASHSGINDLWPDQDRVTYLVLHKDMIAMLDAAISDLEAKP